LLVRFQPERELHAHIHKPNTCGHRETTASTRAETQIISKADRITGAITGTATDTSRGMGTVILRNTGTGTITEADRATDTDSH